MLKKICLSLDTNIYIYGNNITAIKNGYRDDNGIIYLQEKEDIFATDNKNNGAIHRATFDYFIDIYENYKEGDEKNTKDEYVIG